MTETGSAAGRSAAAFALALAVLLGAAFGIYRLAFGAGFMFDDVPNLSGLRLATDWDAARTFVFSGEGGPLGRPLALLTFLLNQPSWPQNPADFLYTNALVHLLNGALAVWLAYRIAGLFGERIARPELFAVVAGGLWTLHPLLASTSLMVVQRMTSLCATGALIGLLLYVAGRAVCSRHPVRGGVLMAAGVAGGTLLATAAKENGALLPLLILVLESTIIRSTGVAAPRWFGAWKAAFLLAPTAVLLGYVIWKFPGIVSSYSIRHFDLAERLLTESRVTATYATLLIAPVASRLGPFHDDFTVSTGLLEPATTLVCVIAWAVAIGGALAVRRRAPLVSFGVLWFVAGHLMESTVFSLELYFEHRNYLPALGPILAITLGAWTLRMPERRLALGAIGTYGMLSGLVLAQTTSLWGQPALAAELWYLSRPASDRAAQYRAQQQMLRGDYAGARRTVVESGAIDPSNTGLALQAVQMSCFLEERPALLARLEDSLARAATGKFNFAALDATEKMIDAVMGGECRTLEIADVQRVLDTLLSNRKFLAQPLALSNLYSMKARLAMAAGDLDGSVRYLESAFSVRPDVNTALATASLLGSAGLYNEAMVTLDHALSVAPANPVKREHWRRSIEELKAALEAGRAESRRG